MKKLGLYDGEVHGVLHGTGECLAWTLFISGEANEGAYVDEESMLIP